MNNSAIKEDKKNHLIRKKPVLWGIGASSILLTLYVLILTAANSFSHVIEQFQEMWYWIFLLVVGFGVQAGLFAYIKGSMKLRKDSGVATSSVAAAGSISTTSMVACCAHHATDILPILGASAAAVFLTQYQNLFIIVGLLSNLIGITVMLKIIQKHNLYHSENMIFNILMSFDMNKSLYVVSALSAFTFLLTLYKSL